MPRLLCAILAIVVCTALPSAAQADPASSEPLAVQHGLVESGYDHTCAITRGDLRCWGDGAWGQLGYGNKNAIGDNEPASAAGPVKLGAGRSARAVSAGFGTCAILDDGSVRCWGANGNGQTGYGFTSTAVGDDETPDAYGPVDLGAGRTARALASGASFHCALLDDGHVRCWGQQGGWLGYGNTQAVGDNETPGSMDPVNLGTGRTATAIAAGDAHACAILDDGTVRCWGYGFNGELGYGAQEVVGDNEVPASKPPVNLGPGRTAKAITAGGGFTCAILDDGSVRCWGGNDFGQLGAGNVEKVGDDEAPGSKPSVDLGGGRTARSVVAGIAHACAILDNGSVRCWGFNGAHALGYPGKGNVGDDETPGGVGPVALGTGRSARALGVGSYQTCALLDDGGLLCWGSSATGRLGYGNGNSVGDDEVPAAAGPVPLGGAIFSRVADLGLAASFDRAIERVGQQAKLMLTLANAGPDASSGAVSVSLPAGLELVSASAGAGSFDAAAMRWTPGAVASGAAPKLELVVRVTGEGTLAASAQLTGSDALDGAAGNDQASASLTGIPAHVTPDPKPDPKPDPRPELDTLAPSFTGGVKLRPAKFRRGPLDEGRVLAVGGRHDDLHRREAGLEEALQGPQGQLHAAREGRRQHGQAQGPPRGSRARAGPLPARDGRARRRRQRLGREAHVLHRPALTASVAPPCAASPHASTAASGSSSGCSPPGR